ncbi:MAG: uroporphyrinogen-III C-methyltransferase [Acidobacteria bacterium SCN 69-37]|nr:MAG: uroporphyrinogen-III C-methyltransferase [Acidobacteria bacterium SCN 69-37]
MTVSPGRVSLIGAGPGDPGLITTRGARLLAQADVVVYDDAVEPSLRWARPDAERIAVGSIGDEDTAQTAISMLLAEKAREGLSVARLMWGDPFVFDSGGRDAMFLRDQHIPFEIVPGVPAAIGSSAYAGIPITYPGAGDAVVLLRGQERLAARVPDVDWAALARLDGTIASFTRGTAAGAILRKLTAAGLPGDTPVALVRHGTRPSQDTCSATLATMAEALADGADHEGLLVIGKVTGLRDHLRWFDDRPLFGRRIVVTRSTEQAPELVESLEALGAQAVQAPTIRIVAAEDPEALDRAAAGIDEYDWVVIESAGAATRLLTALTRGPRDLRALGRVAICALGPSTADRLAAMGIRADVVAPEVGAERLCDAMSQFAPIDGRRVLVVRPDVLRDVVPQELTRQGATVTDLVAYRTEPVPPDAPRTQALYRQLLEGHVDAVTFTSPTALRQFAVMIGEEQAVDLLNTTTVVTIGPVTAAAALEMGVQAPIVPAAYTVGGLIDAIRDHFRRR